VGGAIGRSAFELVGAGGRFCAFGMASGALAGISDGDATRRNVAVTWGARVPPEDFLRLTQTALSEAAAGRLRPVIGQTFPLEQVAEAHAVIEARATLGKTLLLASPRRELRGDAQATSKRWRSPRGGCQSASTLVTSAV
jgi:NADPH:quinone reductase